MCVTPRKRREVIRQTQRISPFRQKGPTARSSMNEPDSVVAPPRRRWLQFSLATLLWLLSSYLLSLYVAKLANFDATYGSIGAVVGIMLWFYLSAYAALLGAELNAQLELADRGKAV